MRKARLPGPLFQGSDALLPNPFADFVMYELSQFSLGDMTRCGIELRKLGEGATSMEEVADRTVRHLHANLRTEGLAAPACALIRTFVTMPFSSLQPSQQQFAQSLMSPATAQPTTKCLTLLGTVGENPRWNSRLTSEGHAALPLPSVESISRSPMIAQLIRQLGIEVETLLGSDPDLVIDTAQHTFNVFYVANAVGSAFIPAQKEFVTPYGVRSVLGFGGLLPPGELFATILFSRVSIPREVADLFKTLALNTKVALLPFIGRRVFT